MVVPYFWSDQYDVKIQCLGEPEAADIVHVVEDDGRKFLAYYERDGVLVGVVGGGMPGKVMKARAKIAAARTDRRNVELTAFWLSRLTSASADGGRVLVAGDLGVLDDRRELLGDARRADDGRRGLVGVGIAVRVGELGPRFAGDQRPGGGVPGLVGHHHAGVQGALGDEGEVQRRRPDHADALDAGHQLGGERQPVLIQPAGVVADGVVAQGHDGPAEAVGGAGVDPPAAQERTLAVDGVVGLGEQGSVGDGDDGAAAPQQGQRYRAQREPVDEVRCSVDGSSTQSHSEFSMSGCCSDSSASNAMSGVVWAR